MKKFIIVDKETNAIVYACNEIASAIGAVTGYEGKLQIYREVSFDALKKEWLG